MQSLRMRSKQSAIVDPEIDQSVNIDRISYFIHLQQGKRHKNKPKYCAFFNFHSITWSLTGQTGEGDGYSLAMNTVQLRDRWQTHTQNLRTFSPSTQSACSVLHCFGKQRFSLSLKMPLPKRQIDSYISQHLRDLMAAVSMKRWNDLSRFHRIWFQSEITTTSSEEFEIIMKDATRSRSWLYQLSPIGLVYFYSALKYFSVFV